MWVEMAPVLLPRIILKESSRGKQSQHALRHLLRTVHYVITYRLSILPTRQTRAVLKVALNICISSEILDVGLHLFAFNSRKLQSFSFQPEDDILPWFWIWHWNFQSRKSRHFPSFQYFDNERQMGDLVMTNWTHRGLVFWSESSSDE